MMRSIMSAVKWMCLSTGTLQEPKWNATDWAQIEGNSELTLEFSSSNGL
ncbi:hypothetical protein [Bacteroides sp. 14(A)]|nr:hypothetical protein [Bacteroides sp. 14(A)]